MDGKIYLKEKKIVEQYFTGNHIFHINSISEESDSLFWNRRSRKKVFLEKCISVSWSMCTDLYVSGGHTIDRYGIVGIMYYVEKTNTSCFRRGICPGSDINASGIYMVCIHISRTINKFNGVIIRADNQCEYFLFHLIYKP